MAIKWQDAVGHFRVSSLKLSGNFRARLSAPHVLARAQSTEKVGRINLPAVCRLLGKVKRREVAAGEDRVAASVLLACWKKTNPEGLTDRWALAVTMALAGEGMNVQIAVREFDADDEADILLVRAHENAERREGERDKWLASLAATRRDSDGAETTEGADAASPSAATPAPSGTFVHVLGEVPENPFSTFPDVCSCGHAQEQHGDFGAPNCTECTCEMFEVEGAQPPSGISDMEPCATCGHACLDHQGADSGCEARKCKCKAFVLGEGVQQQGGVPSVPLAPAAGSAAVPKQPVTVEAPKEKAKRRKEAAELATAVTGKPVTPAAVKQAEYRERKRAGETNPRQKHDDGGAPLSPYALTVQRVYIDVHRDLTGAITRLGNALKEHPEIGERPFVSSWLDRLKEVAKEVREGKPESPCVFCLAACAKDPKTPCATCMGQRWISKKVLGEAPTELRKAAGL